MGLYFTTNDDLFKAQKDVLWTDVSTNTLMPATGLDLTNQKFNTKNKRVIGAVNEVLKRSETAIALSQESLDTMKSVLGDVSGDDELKTKFESMGGNVVTIMSQIKDSVQALEKKEVTILKIDGGAFEES